MKKICVLLVITFFALTSFALAENFKFKRISDKLLFKGDVEYAPGEVLVKFKASVSQQKMAEIYSSVGTSVLSDHRGDVKKLRVPSGMTEHEFISRLEQDPNVEYAELNTKCHAFMTPNDPYYSPYQWHFPKINCPAAWDVSTGSGVVVGILDSGIAYENFTIPSYELSTVQSGVTSYMQAPDLAGTAFTAGYDFINDDSHPNDNNGHGTHVAGTIAQTTNNSYGVAGMAFNCTLMPVKVLDYSGSGTAQSLADGLYWATDNGAQVINMSLGWSPGYNPGATVQNAIIYAYNHGVVLVASSGNAGVSPVSYPAAYSQVIAVGATRYDDNLTYYSQYGSAQEVVAPGGDMDVDQNGDGYGDGVLQQSFDPYDPGPPVTLANPTSFGWWFYIGTSQAAPHVSALVAMMIANGQTGIENIRTILHETAVDLGTAGWDQYYGYGRIDAYAALTYGPEPPVADFVGDPTSGTAPLTVDFTDQSTNNPTAWEWDFGDATPHSFVQNPSHTYADPGDYTVSLTASNTYGSDTEIKANYIHVTSGPYLYSSSVVVSSVYDKKKKQYYGKAVITVKDQNGAKMSGATVYAHWSGLTSDTDQGLTNSRGVVTFYSDRITAPHCGYFVENVDNIVKSGYWFNPAVGETEDSVYSCVSGKLLSGIPEEFEVSQNYPNPFNAATEFSIALPEETYMSLVIYNVAGQKVKTLVDDYMSAGTHILTWDGTNENSNVVSSGIYFYKVVAGNIVTTKKMILMK